MSIASETQRIIAAKAAIKTAVESKGISVGDTKIDGYAQCIEMIPTGPTYEGQTTINENGTVSCAGMLMANDLTIDVKGGIEGAACGKFTWDGSYPVYCDCSALKTAPTCILIFSPELIYSSSSATNAAVIAARGIGTSTTTWFVTLTQKNTVTTSLAHNWIIYDAASHSVLIKSASAGTLVSGKDYYWIAV